jgi:hypothetical protein
MFPTAEDAFVSVRSSGEKTRDSSPFVGLFVFSQRKSGESGDLAHDSLCLEPSSGVRWAQKRTKDRTMRFANRLLAALCCLAIGTGGIASAAPVTENVVFGNLGPTASDPLSGTNTDILVSATAPGQFSALAQGFTTGNDTSFLKLQSVILGLFAQSGVSSRTVSLYTNNAGVPGTEVAVSSAVAVGATGKYTFNFSNVALSANTGYWIVPQSEVSWHLDSNISVPGVQNASGYSYLGTSAKTFASGGSWAASGLTQYSLSVQAVPEPSTYALAALGLGVAGIVRARRRKSTV